MHVALVCVKMLFILCVCVCARVYLYVICARLCPELILSQENELDAELTYITEGTMQLSAGPVSRGEHYFYLFAEVNCNSEECVLAVPK